LKEEKRLTEGMRFQPISGQVGQLICTLFDRKKICCRVEQQKQSQTRINLAEKSKNTFEKEKMKRAASESNAFITQSI
jgi:hypothetical protein